MVDACNCMLRCTACWCTCRKAMKASRLSHNAIKQDSGLVLRSFELTSKKNGQHTRSNKSLLGCTVRRMAWFINQLTCICKGLSSAPVKATVMDNWGGGGGDVMEEPGIRLCKASGDRFGGLSLELPATCMCLDRFGRLSDVMENGMTPDFELPEVEVHLEDIHAAPLEGDELQLDQDAGPVFCPAPALGQGKPPAHMLGQCLENGCWIGCTVWMMVENPCTQHQAKPWMFLLLLLPSHASDSLLCGAPAADSAGNNFWIVS